jgi:acyl-CoA synthetase (AMP-forming)/AMP-acid ligase II
MGEELKALVVPVDPADPPGEDELLGYVRQRLSHYKCPRSVQIVPTLNRNTMGKVNKRVLRAPWWQQAAAAPEKRPT